MKKPRKPKLAGPLYFRTGPRLSLGNRSVRVVSGEERGGELWCFALVVVARLAIAAFLTARSTITAVAAAFTARTTVTIAAASAAAFTARTTIAVAAPPATTTVTVAARSAITIAAFTRFARGTAVGQLFAGFLVDEAHRQADLAALVDLDQLDLDLLAFGQDVADVFDPVIPDL